VSFAHKSCKPDVASDQLVRIDFIVLLAEAVWKAGAPQHSISGVLYTAAHSLEIQVEFLVLGSVVFVMLGTPYDPNARTHAVRNAGPTHFRNLAEIEYIFHAVINDEMSADAASRRLEMILYETPPMSIWLKTACAFVCSLAIGPVAFGASFLDMWVGAGCSALLVHCQEKFAKKNMVLESIYE
jgi:uncharacterized membrane protein YjjP (DUF1212 family)